MEVNELVEYGKALVDHYACYFFADDLKFFRKSGRVSGLKAFMGNLIGIRPIIYMNDKGMMESVSKRTSVKTCFFGTCAILLIASYIAAFVHI